MKAKYYLFILINLLLGGCATQSGNPANNFNPIDLSPKIQRGELRQTTHNLMVLTDTSSSMSDVYDGLEFGAGETKLTIEKELISRLNKTLNKAPLSSALRSFGFGPCSSWGFTYLNKPMGVHSEAIYKQAIESLKCSGGGTPIQAALDAANNDMKNTTGNIALILISDGQGYTPSVFSAVEEFKSRYADRLCLITIWVGNESDEAGQATLATLSDITECGFSTTVDALVSPQQMANFVTDTFYKASHPAPLTTQSDNNPNSLLEAEVNEDNMAQEEWHFAPLYFSFDQASISPDAHPLLNKVVKMLSLNPNTTLEILGHTDNQGPEWYNNVLSNRRAESVKEYIVQQGIGAVRLFNQGYGKSKPISDNATEAGRQMNRRVVIKRTDFDK